MQDIITNWSGPIVYIGFGSIARGLHPLLERHVKFDSKKMFIIEPRQDMDFPASILSTNIVNQKLSKDNYRSILDTILQTSEEQTLIINLSVDVSSIDIIEYAHQNKALYIDTVVEPWHGYYSDANIDIPKRTNYFLREQLLETKRRLGSGVTAVACCGANPGMVSWFVKQALLNLAKDSGLEVEKPQNRTGWAELMHKLEVKGIHIAELDSQISSITKQADEFVNTWSVDGIVSEAAYQPAELGWGTHEKALPKIGHEHAEGCRAAIYLDTLGGETKVRSWVPTGPQEAFLVTHNEAISIPDYFSLRDSNGKVISRPTCHYAYRPSADTIISMQEMFDQGYQHPKSRIMTPEEIVSGSDDLGVLLYGHKKNAYWFGSMLSTAEAKTLVPNQTATVLQVSSSVLAGIIWMINNPNMGIVETEEMDFEFCLNIQRQYLGNVTGMYTDWKPVDSEKAGGNYEWQFTDILIQE